MTVIGDLHSSFRLFVWEAWWLTGQLICRRPPEFGVRVPSSHVLPMRLIPGTPVSSPVHALQADGRLVVRSVGMCVPSSVRRAGTLSRVFTAPSVPSSPDQAPFPALSPWNFSFKIVTIILKSRAPAEQRKRLENGCSLYFVKGQTKKKKKNREKISHLF